MMYIFILALACSVLAIQAQDCSNVELLLVCDESENAAFASSTVRTNRDFDIFINEMKKVFAYTPFANAQNFRFGAIGYSSNTATTIVNPGSTIAQALANVDRFGIEKIGGGSWTDVGAQAVVTSPTTQKNLLIFIMSQGSADPIKREYLRGNVTRIIGLGWNVMAIGFKGGNTMDEIELAIANNQRPADIYYDQNPADPSDPKSFKLLSEVLIRIITDKVCKPSPTVSPPVTGGPCSRCKFESGTPYAPDEKYCDVYYHCNADGTFFRKMCPAGTYFDGTSCNHISSVPCSKAPCNRALTNTNYENGKCCNTYYTCNGEYNVENTCPAGQAYDPVARNCFTPSDLKAHCSDRKMLICNYNISGPLVRDCNEYSPDPTGNPCMYRYAGYSLQVAAGTFWDQLSCSLVFSSGNMCTLTNTDKIPLETDSCTETFLANYENNNLVVKSPRLKKDITVHTNLMEAYSTSQGVVFTESMSVPQLYYYYFSKKEMQMDFALRFLFSLNQPKFNTEYDVFSNAYCSMCKETIGITVVATNSNKLVFSVVIMTNANKSVTASAEINVNAVTDKVQIIVTFGLDKVAIKLYAYNSANAVYRSTDVISVPNDAKAGFMPNECGFMLGRGSHVHFQGTFYQFGVTELCQNIASILV